MLGEQQAGDPREPSVILVHRLRAQDPGRAASKSSPKQEEAVVGVQGGQAGGILISSGEGLPFCSIQLFY